MRRRHVMAGMGAAGLGLAAAGGATFRWHSPPRRHPFLTDAHLRGLADVPARPARVLFVGNSFTLMHDIPGRVAALAGQEGPPIRAAMAAAHGARLIETWRIEAFREVLDAGWDILVLQDHSGTCLRAPDRWGSAWAMRAMAEAARAGAVLLYPPWAFPPRHGVYHGEAGFLARTPQDPDDFARMITAFHERLARAEGWIRAPVTEAFMPDATPWLKDDLHHLDPGGADRVAGILWEHLKGMLR